MSIANNIEYLRGVLGFLTEGKGKKVKVGGETEYAYKLTSGEKKGNWAVWRMLPGRGRVPIALGGKKKSKKR